MEEERQRIYTIVAIVAVATLLLSCVAAVVAGGLAGFFAGRSQARAIGTEQFGPMPGPAQQVPVPMPEPGGGMSPFGQSPAGVQGAHILQVLPGTAAEQAGLQEGDVILAIDSAPIDQNHALADVIAQYEPGDRITIEFWRQGQTQAVRATLGENPDSPGQPYLGVRFQMNLQPDSFFPGN
jgi:membrane-associated protease RseP (regulator of RpoE activity)